MPLFHPRVITKALEKAHAQPIPAEHLDILSTWAERISTGRILKENETMYDAVFISRIMVGILGYADFAPDGSCTLKKNQPVGKGNVDVALGCFNDTETSIVAPFELKGAKTKDLDAIMAGRHKSPVQQAWEYAMDAPGAKWVLVSNYLEIRLYAVGYGRQDYEQFDLANLTQPVEYHRFMLFLSAANLLGGRTLALLKESDKVGKDITNQLYNDYRNLREELILSLRRDNHQFPELDIISHAQTILDRVLFIAFAEDRGLLPEHTLEKAYTHTDPYNPKPVWDNFKGLFAAIDKGNPHLNIPKYNGGLFAPDAAVEALTVSNELCEGFKKLGDYDYNTEVSVTVLGHIFEQSITDLEALQAIVKGEQPEESKGKTTGKRKREGVVYTPDSITRFIVEQTLGGYLHAQLDALLAKHAKGRSKAGEWKTAKAEVAFWEDYQNALKATKVVDPACGSGAFLVAAFDYLYAEYTRVNDRLTELKGGTRGLFDLDKEILNSNLYGVDINHESIEISKLSLWLKTAQRGKVLNSLDNNLRVGDSLIEDSNFSYRAFTWKDAFPQVFAAGGFDVVLGNPPYVRHEFISSLKPYLEKRYEVYNGTADLYTYFFELGLRLMKKKGRMGYICSSSFFKSGSGKQLRSYLLEHAKIEAVVDFGDIKVFEGVTTYPAVMIMEKENADTKHSLNFLGLSSQLETDLAVEFRKLATLFTQKNLGLEAWKLEGGELLALRLKIKDGKKPLKDIYGSPYRGILTGLTDAFVINSTTSERLLRHNPQTSELIRPYLVGDDFAHAHVQPQGLSLILIPKGWTREKSGLTEETAAWQWFSDAHPALAEWLSPFAERARKRSDKGEFWWELRACAYYDAFTEEKIVYPDMSQGPKFSVDHQGFVFGNTGYFIKGGGYFLNGLLNSRVVWLYLLGICDALRGGIWRLRMFTQNIETIPIPATTDPQKAAIATLAEQCQSVAEARYKLQDAVRRRIPDLSADAATAKLNEKLKSWWELDFTNFRKEVKKAFKADIALKDRSDWEAYLNDERAKVDALTQRLTALEFELNTKVYELFALTPAEIKLLEAELEGKM